MLLCVVTAGALAQTSPGRLDDVTVTTTRGPTSVQALPASISALDPDAMRQRGEAQTRDLPLSTPNLVWQAGDGALVASVYLRGIGSASIHPNQQSPVALNLDGITLNAPQLAHFGLYDLERVDVLRGTQPADFGRTGSGGTVQFVTRAPDPRAAGYAATVTTGNEGRLDATGALNVPTSASSALRLAASSGGRSDFIRNRTLGTREGDSRRNELRAQWAIDRRDGFAARVTALAGRFHGDTIRYKQVGLGTPGAPGRSNCPFLASDRSPGNGCTDQTGFADTRSFTENFSDGPNLFDGRVDGGSVRLRWRGAHVELTSLTGYVHGASRRAEDTDGGPSALFVSNQQTDSRQWSQELRLAAAAPGEIDWTLGAYAFGEKSRYTSDRRNPNALLTPVLVPGVPISATNLPNNMLFGDLDQRDESRSLFARMSRHVGKRGTLDAQLRWTHDRKYGAQRAGIYADRFAEIPVNRFIGTPELDALLRGAVQVEPGPLPALCPRPFPLSRCYSTTPFDGSWQNWSGRLTWSLQFSERVLGYAAIARGTKSGGVSPIAVDVIFGVGGALVPPESVRSVEAGVKSEWRDGKLRVNVAAFHDDWSDYQLFLSVNGPTGIVPRLASLPKSRSQGGELEVDWAPVPGWRVGAWAAIADTRVTDIGTTTDAIVGSPLPGTPRVTGSARVQREWTLASGTIALEANWYRAGKRVFNLARDPNLEEPAYDLLGASLAYALPRRGLELSLWGRNLTGTRYCILRQSLAGLGSGDAIGCVPNEGERMLGLTLSVAR